MARSRFILRFRGRGPIPDADLARVSGLAGVVVTESTAKMLLVESDPATLQALLHSLDDWVMAPEQAFPLPDVRRRADRPPEAPHPS